MELALQYSYDCYSGNSQLSHNPCFYGISFAIQLIYLLNEYDFESQSLFLWN